MTSSDNNRAGSMQHLPQAMGGQAWLAESALRQGYLPGAELNGVQADSPPGLKAKPDPVALLRAFGRRWLLAMTLGLLAAGGTAAAVWYLVPPKYVASSTVMIRSRSGALGAVGEKPLEFNMTRNTVVSMLKSRLVLLKALSDPKVKDLKMVRELTDPVEWLEKNLRADSGQTGGTLIRVSLTGSDPRETITLLNSIVNNYLRESVEEERKERADKLQRLNQAQSSFDERLRRDRQTLQDLALSSGAVSGVGVQLKHHFDQDLLAAKNKDLIDVRRRGLALKTELARELEREKNKTPPIVSEMQVRTRLRDDRSIKSFEDQMQVAAKGIETAAAFYSDGDKNPRVVKMKEQLEALKAGMIVHMNKQRASIIEVLRAEMINERKSNLQKQQDQLLTLQDLEAALLTEIAKLKDQINQSLRGGVDMELLSSELERKGAFAAKLRDSIRNLEIEANAPTRMQLLDEAFVGTEAAIAQKMVFAGVAGGAALLAVVALISLWEFQTRRIHSSHDVAAGLGWRVVGALPALPDRRRRQLTKTGGDHYWDSLLTESVDATRTMLVHAARTEGLKTVMVTSAVAGEAKTSLASHLATSLARSGRKTLLIDCDLRSPAVHRLFDVPHEPGFCELLKGSTDSAEVIRSTPLDNLWVITAGSFDSQVLQALAQENLPNMLNRLKEQFDFIVVDSSPILPVADSLLIGQHADILIFSLLKGVSRIPNVYAAYERLRPLGVRMLGAVVNGVTSDYYGYSTYYRNGRNGAAKTAVHS